MATTTKRLEIELAWTTDESSLFADGITDGADVQESMAVFDGLLISAVREAFPEAIVEMADRGRIWEINEDDDVNGADTEMAHEAGLTIQAIADDIIQRGDWIIPA